MKTPITSIRAFSEILLDENLDEVNKRRFLQIIIDETGRMSRLIDQVLDLERFDSGKQKLNMTKTDLAALVKETAESMEQVFGEKGLQFQLKLSFERLEIMVDPDRIRQVLLNLLSNASKFAASKVILTAMENEGDLILEVQDDGKGIPEKEIPHIFDKFYQAKNQTSLKPIGRGLGLAISKKIVDYHGGTVNASRENGMTIFRVLLPKQLKAYLNLNSKIAHE